MLDHLVRLVPGCPGLCAAFLSAVPAFDEEQRAKAHRPERFTSPYVSMPFTSFAALPCWGGVSGLRPTGKGQFKIDVQPHDTSRNIATTLTIQPEGSSKTFYAMARVTNVPAVQ